MKIAIVAPSSRLSEEAAGRVRKVAAAAFPKAELVFHPQCFLSHNHFAGTDEARAEALVEVANDPGFDAVWFARGGYGACRIVGAALARFAPAAREKAWLGYSDAGFLLAALYRAGFPHVAHGPMPQDVLRENGEAAVKRALAWLTARDPASLEGGLEPGVRHAAFNIAVLGTIVGTPLEPDLSDHILLLEEVSEYAYRTDRALFHLTAQPGLRRVAGLRLGRVSDVPPNDPDFGMEAEEIARFRCERSGIAWLGRADIGHDADNKVVPFGAS